MNCDRFVGVAIHIILSIYKSEGHPGAQVPDAMPIGIAQQVREWQVHRWQVRESEVRESEVREWVPVNKQSSEKWLAGSLVGEDVSIFANDIVVSGADNRTPKLLLRPSSRRTRMPLEFFIKKRPKPLQQICVSGDKTTAVNTKRRHRVRGVSCGGWYLRCRRWKSPLYEEMRKDQVRCWE
jgi:hypothetical protein